MKQGLSAGVKFLLCFLGIVFLLEVFQSGALAPSARKLAQLGASSAILAERESIYWLRIFTALFLHGNLLHLFSNSIAILIGGPFLERLIGKHWLLAIFLYSGALGSIVSIMFSDPRVVSIGASGGIMGIFTAAFILVNIKVIPEYRRDLNIVFLQSLIPSLIPLSRGVDYAAHFGGAIGGAICSLLVLAFWPNTETEPKGEFLAWLLIALFAFASSAAFSLTIWSA